MKNQRILTLLIIYFVSLIWIETLFVLINQINFDVVFIRVLLFTVTLTFILTLITVTLPNRLIKVFYLLIMGLFSFYAFMQSSFHHYMGYYLSFTTANNQATNVTDYIANFILTIPFHYYLLLLPWVLISLALFTGFLHIPTSKKIKGKQFFTLMVQVAFLHLLSTQTLLISFNDLTSFNPNHLYQQPTMIELSIKEFGILRFFTRDFIFSFNDVELTTLNPSDLDVSPVLPVDHTDHQLRSNLKSELWLEILSKETDVTLKQIDEYLYSQPIPLKNNFTGQFKHYNLIYIMVEAFDYNAIHPVLTPTLYKIFKDGWTFDEFYSVKASCATGESEFMGLTSLIPNTTGCTPYEFTLNDGSASLFTLFKNAGYQVTSYHNYIDQFYPRTSWHQALGSQKFYDSDALKVPMLKGWPSDVELMKRAYDVFKDHQQPFMAFIITSAMHFFYDTDTTLGNRYLDLVQSVYPDASIDFQRYLSKSIDFDKSIEALLQLLSDDKKLDQTLLVLYGDHHPYRLELSELREYSMIDRSGLNIDKNPLIMYNPKLTPTTYPIVSSQIDLLPTIANLFDLAYDPRLYIGHDLFSVEDNFVIFTNGSWKNSVGEYWAISKKFVPFDQSNTYSIEQLNQINHYIQSRFLISNQILKTDYYNYRTMILP